VALAARFIVEEELKSGTLVSLLPEYSPVGFTINAIYPHRRHLAATVRAFIDMSVERFVEHQRWMDPFLLIRQPDQSFGQSVYPSGPGE
jgi:DNA-binding transcriptional LysR family regulator